jgi:hypothetical protein
LKLRWESNVAEISRENVARDLELKALKDNESKLRVELEQRKHDTERLVVETNFNCLTVNKISYRTVIVHELLLDAMADNRDVILVCCLVISSPLLTAYICISRVHSYIKCSGLVQKSVCSMWSIRYADASFRTRTETIDRVT